MATCSLWTAILEPLSQRRPIRGVELFLGMLVVVGLYVIFHFEFDHAPGLTMAIASAMLASIFTIINGRYTHRYEAQVITLYEMGGAFVSTALFLPFYRTTLAEGGSCNWFRWLPTGCTLLCWPVSARYTPTRQRCS